MTKYKSFEENEDQRIENEVDEDLDEEYELKKWCGVRRSTVLFVFYFVSYFAYLILGGYVMAMLETPHEINLKADVKKMKETFLQDNPHVNRSEFEQLLLKISELHSQGIGFSDSDLESNNWSIGQSLLFTVTVVTTVGYGHVAPITQQGKAFCILYAALGLPFTLVFMSACVQRLLEPTIMTLAWLMSGKVGRSMSPFGVRVIHLLILSTLFVTLFFVIPTLIFCQIEYSWDILDAFYFVFISLTTIGLGDYIPGDQENQVLPDVYKASVAVYLILGIVFMSLTLSVFYDIPQLNLGLQLHSYADIRFNDNTKTLETSSVASMKEAWNEQQSKVSKVLSSGTTTPKTSAPNQK